MKCYQHRSTEAIGVCKSCGKAVCEDCAIDLGFAITCSSDCERIAIANHKLNSNAITLYSEQKKNKYIGPSFIIILGFVFIAFGFADRQPIYSFSFVSGLCFLTFGIILFVIQRRYIQKINA